VFHPWLRKVVSGYLILDAAGVQPLSVFADVPDITYLGNPATAIASEAIIERWCWKQAS